MTAPSASRIAITNAIAYAVAIAVSFIQAPFLIHQLGDERYGLWTLIGLVTGYYGLLDLGTRGAVGFFVARARARNATVEIAEVTASAFWFLAGAAGVVLVVGSAVLVLFPDLFRIAPAWRTESAIALAIALAATVLTLPLDVFAAVVNGCRRGELITLSETVVRVLTVIAIFALFRHGARLDLLAAIMISGKVVVWAIAFTTARRLEPSWSVSPRFWRRGRLREITRYGLQTFVINVASVFVERIDALVIGLVLGARLVTFYVIGQSLISYLTQAVLSITLALTPFFADLSAKDDAHRTRHLFFLGMRASSLVTGIIAGGIFAFGRAFVARWVGVGYVTGDWHNRSDVVMLLLLVAMVPRLLHSTSHQYLFGTNKQAFLSRVLVFEGAANLALSLALVRPLGLAGIALGTVLPSFVSHGWFLPRFVASSLGVSARQLFLEGQARGVAVGVAVAAIGFAVTAFRPPTTWPTFFGGVVVTLLVATPLLWYVGLAEADRETVRARLRRRRAASLRVESDATPP